MPLAVVDTNAWLDLFLFADPDARALHEALAAGRLRAVRTGATDAELRAVLARPAFAARLLALQCPAPGPDTGADPRALASPAADAANPGAPAAAMLLARWEALASIAQISAHAPWTCRDPDDQKFLDLAHSAGAALLVSKDRDLLGLAARARRGGLWILTPRDFGRDGAL